MIAKFYIVAESFAQNGNSTRAEIESKIQALGNDFVNIRRHKDTNNLYVNPEIYNMPFINEVSISDLLYNDAVANQNLDRDARNMLKKVILETPTTNISSQEVIEVLLPEHDEKRCHGLIAFNEVTEVKPEFQVVYDHNGWLNFRRYYLSKYPKNEAFFITECEKYFPELIFHSNTSISIKPIFKDFHKKIIYHLTVLNDRFRDSQDGIRNRQQVLDHFSGNCNLDANATLEGNAERKPYFTYDFINNEGNNQKVCCEPHMKLCSTGIPGDNKYYQHRIYFHEGVENISDSKILIGHIGVHL